MLFEMWDEAQLENERVKQDVVDFMINQTKLWNKINYHCEDTSQYDDKTKNIIETMCYLRDVFSGSSDKDAFNVITKDINKHNSSLSTDIIGKINEGVFEYEKDRKYLYLVPGAVLKWNGSPGVFKDLPYGILRFYNYKKPKYIAPLYIIPLHVNSFHSYTRRCYIDHGAGNTNYVGEVCIIGKNNNRYIYTSTWINRPILKMKRAVKLIPVSEDEIRNVVANKLINFAINNYEMLDVAEGEA